MDFTPEYLDTLRAAGIPAFCSDFEHLSDHVAPASFDVITAFHVFEHVPDVYVAAETCRLALRPGGWLVVAVPLADSWQAKLLGARWLGVTEAPRHVTVPSQEGIHRVLATAGIEVTRVLPDAVLNIAGMLSLSLLPGSALTNRTRGGLLKAAATLTSMAFTVSAIPWAVGEGYLAGRPGAGLFFGRRVE